MRSDIFSITFVNYFEWPKREIETYRVDTKLIDRDGIFTNYWKYTRILLQLCNRAVSSEKMPLCGLSFTQL